MYGGIGLKTARGSGTNGYVQRNLSYIKPVKKTVKAAEEEYLPPVRPMNPEILLHTNKRMVEVKCLELYESLEGTMAEEDIKEQVQILREKLTAKMEKSKRNLMNLQDNEASELPDLKVQEIERMRQAFSLDSNFKENSFFRRGKEDEPKNDPIPLQIEDKKELKRSEKEEGEVVSGSIKKSERRKPIPEQKRKSSPEQKRESSPDDSDRRRKRSVSPGEKTQRSSNYDKISSDQRRKRSRSPEERRKRSPSPEERRKRSNGPEERKRRSRSPEERRKGSPSVDKRKLSRSRSPRRRRSPSSDQRRKRSRSPDRTRRIARSPERTKKRSRSPETSRRRSRSHERRPRSRDVKRSDQNRRSPHKSKSPVRSSRRQ